MIKKAREIITNGGDEDSDFFISENPVKIKYHYENGPMQDNFLRELIVDGVFDFRTGKELTEQNSDVDFYNIKNYIEEYEADSEMGDKEDMEAFGPRDTDSYDNYESDLRKREFSKLDKIIKKAEPDPFVTINWIESSLVNDENSSDDELRQYFLDNGLDENTVNLIMDQRESAFMSGMHFELDTDGMDFSNCKNGIDEDLDREKYKEFLMDHDAEIGKKEEDAFNSNQDREIESSLKITKSKSAFVPVSKNDAKNGLSCTECGRQFKENDLVSHEHAPGTPSGLVTYCPACKHDRDKENGGSSINKNMRPAYEKNSKIRRNVRQANLKVIAGMSLMEAIEKAKSMSEEEKEEFVSGMIRARGWRLVIDLVKEFFNRVKSLAKTASTYDGFEDVKNKQKKEKSPIKIALEGIRDSLTLLTFILMLTAGGTDELARHPDTLIVLKTLVASLGSGALAFIFNNFAQKTK